MVSADVELERDGEGFRLTVDQVQRTTDLPSFARTFAGETTQAVQREVWAGPDGGDLVIEAPGKPTDVRGTIRLEPAGSGTTEVVELTIKVKVPLLGGKLERLMAEKIRAGMDAEHTVGTTWLEEH